jgi:hypothetical protein
MEWSNFLQHNSSAFIALAGVVIGTAVTTVITLLTQSQQHKWAVEAQRREWRRYRTQEQLERILAWQTQWLRTASGIRNLEDELQAATTRSGGRPGLDIRSTKEDLQKQVTLLRDLAAPAFPLIQALDDSVLLDIHDEFMRISSRYESILKRRDFAPTIESNKAIIKRVTELIARTHQRADRLMEQVFRTR